ncbi:membrane-associated protein, putative [Bodo saltans]|uniref:Membrane-associated protein, putative n=1 Tax=Bodo saltans TaxID=75058 RepID=A0A0S4ISM3_BODSA|nr:membrane-associated protein, putative [Bodo saltans]|eukprot:CUG06069.1 membrane-associated protein, putative [Bodo saltans]
MAFTKPVLVLLLLTATVLLAQPNVNVPLMPLSNYIAGNDRAVIGAVLVGDFAFTADFTGLWGININDAAHQKVTFFDAYNQARAVTQMWAWCKSWVNLSSCSLHVIAGSLVVLYKMNDTAVWRAASFRAPKATFDIISDSRSPSYMYPPVLPSEDGTRAFFVLGSALCCLHTMLAGSWQMRKLQVLNS